MADYLAEVEWADAMLGRIYSLLQEKGILDNTVIVFTSDNGMPFPRAKATLYDHGVRMPLIIRWGDRIQAGRTVSSPVSLIDLAPTFLELAGVDIPQQMTGRSLARMLSARGNTEFDLERDFVVSAFEKHTLARPDSLGYPRRAIHTEQWSYIINYEPERWPAGNEDVFVPDWDYFGDVDPSGIKTFFMENRIREDMGSLFDLNFGRVPAEELYHKPTDPDMIRNLAYDPAYASVREMVRAKLENYLDETGDPRRKGESPWDLFYLDK